MILVNWLIGTLGALEAPGRWGYLDVRFAETCFGAPSQKHGTRGGLVGDSMKRAALL
jgi:hypothetical protein